MLSVAVADAGDDFGAVFPFVDEFGDEFWWLLAIGIDSDGGVAFGVHKASGESGLFTKIARQRKSNNVFVLGG